MHYFDEYCEIHLEQGIAPYTWVFRSEETIRVRFGVALQNNPDLGQLSYEWNDGHGHREFGHVMAAPKSFIENGFKMFSVTLPSMKEGSYRYKLGYRDTEGQTHTSQRTRVLLICDEAPGSITEIPSKFLAFIENKPLYGPLPSVKITPGPSNWGQRLFYSLIIDRFAKDSKDHRRGMGMVPYDSSSPHSSHGGTLEGIIEKLDYLKNLGVGVLIISPVYVNEASGYHGYHPIHLLMVDPRLGTLEILQTLVVEAHKRDIAVILDVVVNHLADSIDWEEYGGPPGGEFKYVLGDDKSLLPLPIEARNTNLFHSPKYTDMINQRLFGFLEDWCTETGYVRELLIQHLKFWLSVTDVDGFRYDSARHVGVDFWQPCVAEINRYATYLGKTQFLQIAEHAGSTHKELTAYNKACFSGFIDYPTHYTLKKSLGDGHWLEGFADYFSGRLVPNDIYANDWRNNVMFLDNQDTTRILHEFLSRHHERKIAQSCLHFALCCLILGVERPAIYAGTEQEFCGALGMHQDDETKEWIGHDYHVREDMFHNPACVWKFGPINQPVFKPYNQDHDTFKIIRLLANIRNKNPLLQTGDRILHLSKENRLRSVIIDDHQGSAPLIAVMNLSSSELTDVIINLPHPYDHYEGIDVQLATTNGKIKRVKGQLNLKLPAFTFILGVLV